MLTRSLIVATSLFAASNGWAGDIVIDMGDVPVETATTSYSCGTTTLDVDYVNAGGVSLASFEWQGARVVASNVIAASGARYAGGDYIWWTKGKEASLFDLTNGEDAVAILQCMEKQP